MAKTAKKTAPKKAAKTKQPETDYQTRIAQVTKNNRGIDVKLEGVKLVKCQIAEPEEREYEGTKSYSYIAGILMNNKDEINALVNEMKEHFQTCKAAREIPGWRDAALAHFDEKKFRLTDDGEAYILYPSAPAEELDNGSFQPKGKIFVSPDVDAFYAGCIVDVQIAFVSNTKGAMTIKDYLNGIRFRTDGEPMGAKNPWGDEEVVNRWVSPTAKRSSSDETEHHDREEKSSGGLIGMFSGKKGKK